jgi:hypothetical protein
MLNSMPTPVSSRLNSVNASLHGPIWYYIHVSHLFVPKSSFPQVNFHFPYTALRLGHSFIINPTEQRSELVAKALKSCPNLEIVSSPRGFYPSVDLVTISQNPSLKRIQIQHGFPGVESTYCRALCLEANVNLKNLITFYTPPP